MDFGICLQNYIPVRDLPSERSEMVTQILFGEIFEVLESDRKSRFSYIRMKFDGYEGWIDHKTITAIDNETCGRILELDEFVTTKITGNLTLNDGSTAQVGAGSSLRHKDRIIVYPEYVVSSDEDVTIEVMDKRELVQNLAVKWKNIPYLWGGRSVFGTDCSGFVQNIFKQTGTRLPRDAREQVKTGRTVNFHSEIKTGDLAFFDNEEGNITHVGILLDSNRIIHSSGKVRIDPFDHHGIFSEFHADYSHKLRIIKNVLD